MSDHILYDTNLRQEIDDESFVVSSERKDLLTN